MEDPAEEKQLINGGFPLMSEFKDKGWFGVTDGNTESGFLQLRRASAFYVTTNKSEILPFLTIKNVPGVAGVEDVGKVRDDYKFNVLGQGGSVFNNEFNLLVNNLNTTVKTTGVYYVRFSPKDSGRIIRAYKLKKDPYTTKFNDPEALSLAFQLVTTMYILQSNFGFAQDAITKDDFLLVPLDDFDDDPVVYDIEFDRFTVLDKDAESGVRDENRYRILLTRFGPGAILLTKAAGKDEKLDDVISPMRSNTNNLAKLVKSIAPKTRDSKARKIGELLDAQNYPFGLGSWQWGLYGALFHPVWDEIVAWTRSDTRFMDPEPEFYQLPLLPVQLTKYTQDPRTVELVKRLQIEKAPREPGKEKGEEESSRAKRLRERQEKQERRRRREQKKKERLAREKAEQQEKEEEARQQAAAAAERERQQQAQEEARQQAEREREQAQEEARQRAEREREQAQEEARQQAEREREQAQEEEARRQAEREQRKQELVDTLNKLDLRAKEIIVGIDNLSVEFSGVETAFENAIKKPDFDRAAEAIDGGADVVAQLEDAKRILGEINSEIDRLVTGEEEEGIDVSGVRQTITAGIEQIEDLVTEWTGKIGEFKEAYKAAEQAKEAKQQAESERERREQAEEEAEQTEEEEEEPIPENIRAALQPLVQYLGYIEYNTKKQDSVGSFQVATGRLTNALNAILELEKTDAQHDAVVSLLSKSLLIDKDGNPYKEGMTFGLTSAKTGSAKNRIYIKNQGKTSPEKLRADPAVAPRYFVTPFLITAMLYRGYTEQQAIDLQDSYKDSNTSKGNTPVLDGMDRLLGELGLLRGKSVPEAAEGDPGKAEEEAGDTDDEGEQGLEQFQEEQPQQQPESPREHSNLPADDPEATEEIQPKGTSGGLTQFSITLDNLKEPPLAEIYGSLENQDVNEILALGELESILKGQTIEKGVIPLLASYNAATFGVIKSPAKGKTLRSKGSSQKPGQLESGVADLNEIANTIRQFIRYFTTRWILPAEIVDTGIRAGLFVLDNDKLAVPRWTYRREEDKVGMVFPAAVKTGAAKSEQWPIDHAAYVRLTTIWALILLRLMLYGLKTNNPNLYKDDYDELGKTLTGLLEAEEKALESTGRTSFVVQPADTIESQILVSPGVIADRLAALGLHRRDAVFDNVYEIGQLLTDAASDIIDTVDAHPTDLAELPSIRNAMVNLELCDGARRTRVNCADLLANTSIDEQVEFGRRLFTLASFLDRIHVTGNGSFSSAQDEPRIDIITPFQTPWRKTPTRSTYNV